MIRKTERIECKYPEYPKFLDGTHTYKYIGNSTVPEGDLLLTLGEIEDKIDNGSLIDRDFCEEIMTELLRIKSKAKFYYDKCKEYGIENFCDEELEF